MKTFLIDVDGVCADFLGPAVKIAEKLTGKRYPLDLFTSWDIFEVFPKDIQKQCFEAFHEKDFCAGLEMYPGTLEGLAKLRALGEIVIVTSPMDRSPHWVYERTHWVDKHLGIPPHSQIHTSAKHHIRGDILVDDRPDNVRKWAAAHPEGMGLLWGHHYNKSATDLTRVESWDDVMRMVSR